MSKIGPLVLGSFGKYMKSGGFHEIWQISCMKFGRFHAWNLVDFMHEIRQISCMKFGGFQAMKSGRFRMKSTKFHAWNLPNFMHEICQISWNPPDFMKSGRFHPWNQADFMADLEKCKLENVNFYNAYNFFFYVNQISNSYAVGSSRLSLWPGAISSS